MTFYVGSEFSRISSHQQASQGAGIVEVRESKASPEEGGASLEKRTQRDQDLCPNSETT